MEIKESISKWIELDTKMQNLSALLKEVRTEKNNLETIILNYAEKNNLENRVVEVNNKKVKFNVSKTTEPITFKYLEKNLSNIIKNEDQLQKTIDYLKDNRETKYNYSIKQFNK